MKGLLEAGHVVVDGRPAKAAGRLRGGERVELAIPPPPPSGVVAQDLPLTVVYEDGDLLVLDKAAGMVVHPARGTPHSTVVNALLHRFGAGRPGVAEGDGAASEVGSRRGGNGGESGVAGSAAGARTRSFALPGEVLVGGAPGEGGARLGLVHRLDKDTSGCLVVAKTEAALAALQAAFKARTVEKRYLALCHGALATPGRLDTPYCRHPRDRTRFTSRLESPRRAVTAWTVRERFPGAALAEVELHTGRTHQIRVHLAESGHPLLGDATYGGARREARLPPADPVRRAAEAIGRQALHASSLAFPHPRTGRRVQVEAPLPEDFLRAIDVLRG